MKLLRIGAKGAEKPAILADDGTIRDLSGIVHDIGGAALSPAGLANIAAADLGSLPELDGSERIGPCVADVGKFICIGLNYADHAAETGAAIPAEPIIFMKATSAIVGPNDDVIIPKNAIKPDWEVELGVIIGTEARYVEEADALDHVAGYCVVNDVSERHFQTERGGQWVKGKSADTFGPIGPWLVTRDEIADPHDLNLWLEVDGQRYHYLLEVPGAAERPDDGWPLLVFLHGAGERVAPALHDGADRHDLARVAAREQDRADAGGGDAVRRVGEPLAHVLDRDLRAQDVVAAAVEADRVGLERDGGIELLVQDAGELAPADRQVRVAHRLPLRGCESRGDEVGPAAHAAVGQLVTDALGEAVADGDERSDRLHRSTLRAPRGGTRGAVGRSDRGATLGASRESGTPG